MTFLSMLAQVLIGPLKLIFEVIYSYACIIIGHPGLAIIFLSLAINILVLPLYRRADAMQEEARDREAGLQEGVAHIRKVFSGDERMMILQTYYRQNHYRPLETLNGSISLLLEIPFFIAAYQFLSHLPLLNGVSLFMIKDLAKPDGLIVIGGLAINALPILMTLINIISSVLYLKGFPLKTKIQLYGMALFFLVFLYTSPSGLVFYWTLNNLFSLCKTIFYKLKNPRKVLNWLCAAAGLTMLVCGLSKISHMDLKSAFVLFVLGLALLLPLLITLLQKKGHSFSIKRHSEPDRKLFLLGTIFLTVLTGLQIPSVFIAASPLEFVNITYFYHPLWYIISSFCFAAGTFLVWMRMFYWLANRKGKIIFERLIVVLCGAALVNYMFFGTDLGIISSSLRYNNGLFFTGLEKIQNLLVLLGVAIVLLLVLWRWKRVITAALLITILAFGSMSAVNVMAIKDSINELSIAQSAPQFRLSQTGNNVVIIMLDRALGEDIPYIFHEKPELEEQFDGFTYYENVVSFGGHTNLAFPAMIGGYEYTPVELNKRSTESLVSKHNEALKVMPVIFSENGYETTICDPAYANYKEIPDLRIYNDYPEIQTYITNGYFSDDVQKQTDVERNQRNFFCFSVMKCAPLALQPTIYNAGNYRNLLIFNHELASMEIDAEFMNSYSTLTNLSYMTKVTGDDVDTFLFLANDLTHAPTILQAPDYVPVAHVDNAAYDAEHADRFNLGNREMNIGPLQLYHYHVNMAAMLQLGKWMDYLKANGVYDNTRIILVSDHGFSVDQIKELVFDEQGELDNKLKDVEFYYPLLMVKDFHAEGFHTSDEFMTNADVPTLAMAELIQNPINPFTGKEINNAEKYAHEQFIILSPLWRIQQNNGNTFLPAQWASIKDNLWDINNWAFYDEPIVLDEHAMP